MKPDEFLRLLGEMVWTWLEAVFRPLMTVSRMLREFEPERSLSPVVKLWLPPLTLSLIINYPILNLFGIKWNNFGYYAPEETLVIIVVIMNGLFSHGLLRIFKMKSDVYKTTLLYTLVLIYTPITTLIAIPQAHAYYSYIQALKHDNLDLQELLRRQISNGFLGSTESFNLYQFTLYITSFIGILTLTVYAECIIRHYANDRHKTYLAVGIAAFLMLLAYRWIAEPLHRLTIYSFIQ